MPDLLKPGFSIQVPHLLPEIVRNWLQPLDFWIGFIECTTQKWNFVMGSVRVLSDMESKISCLVWSCSLPCFTVHKATPCEKPAPPAQPVSSTKLPQYQFSTKDTVPPERLQLLGKPLATLIEILLTCWAVWFSAVCVLCLTMFVGLSCHFLISSWLDIYQTGSSEAVAECLANPHVQRMVRELATGTAGPDTSEALRHALQVVILSSEFLSLEN